MRPGEVDGADYHFVTKVAFEKMASEGELLEHASVFGQYYGSPMEPVKEAIDAGKDVLFDIDWQGAQQIQNSSLRDHVLSIFLLPPSIAELRRRLVSRGTDGQDVVASRMRQSWDEISHWDGYDYVLINDDLEDTLEKLKTIVIAERMRLAQQPSLVDFVRTLQGQFQEEEA